MENFEISLPVTRIRVQGKHFNRNRSTLPCLALHGWLDNCHSFVELASRLENQWIVAIDLPGHGRSSSLPPGCDFHFRDNLLWLAELVQVQKWEKLRLMGHSMGAAIASLFAASFPDWVESLVMIEGIGPWSGDVDKAPGRTKEHILSFLKMANRRNPQYESLEKAAQLRQKTGQLSYEIARLLAERGTELLENGSYRWSHDPRLKVPSSFDFSELQVLSFLESIDCPSQLIRASKGYIVKPDPFDRRIQAIKALELQEFEGHHHLHMEKNEALAMSIGQFLERHSR